MWSSLVQLFFKIFVRKTNCASSVHYGEGPWGQAWAEALVFNQKYNTDKE